MFSEILQAAVQGDPVDRDLLGRRFDIAMVKKLGVLNLPPSFWMQDPKINPRTEELLQVALFLEDQERLSLAFSALAAEYAEKNGQLENDSSSLAALLEEQVERFLGLFPGQNGERSRRVRKLLETLIIK